MFVCRMFVEWMGECLYIRIDFREQNESLAYFENVPNQASQLYFQHVLNIIMNIFEIQFVVIMKKIL